MKKFLILVLIVIGVGLLFAENDGDCLEVDEISVGRIYSWDKGCQFSWKYIPKKDAMDGFSLERLVSYRPFLLQFAGPFTDEDGSTQGISFLNGEILEDDGDYYSGYVVVDENGNLKIGNVNEFEDIRSEVVGRNWSGFTQALMVDNGEVMAEVEDNWNMYQENRSYNYRFLIEDKTGKVSLFDGNNIGLNDVLDSLVGLGYRKILYLDIAGSELGYFFMDGDYGLLGGRSVEDRYNPNSPGGFLELEKI